MSNPFETLQKFKSRLGKPVRPIIELQKDCSLVNIITNPVQEGNAIRDYAHDETWLCDPNTKTTAVYIDGVFKGLGHFATEEGYCINAEKVVEPLREIPNDKIKENCEIVPASELPEGVKPTPGHTIVKGLKLSYKGIFSRLLDGGIIERGSQLKPAMTQTLVYCALVGLTMFMMGMSYAARH